MDWVVALLLEIPMIATTTAIIAATATIIAIQIITAIQIVTQIIIALLQEAKTIKDNSPLLPL